MFSLTTIHKHVGLLVLLTLMALAFSGCGSSDNPTDPGGGAADFNAVIKTGGEFEVPVPQDEVVAEETILETVGYEDFFCTTTRYSIVEAPGEFPQFDPNAEVVYPGNLLQGNSLGQATPNPIPVRRGGGSIVMTILNGSPSVSRTMPVVSLGSILEAQDAIIAEANNTIPARFTFTLEEVRSREEFALALDVGMENLFASVDASLNFHQDFEYNRFVVKLVQSYFTMAYESPTAVEDFFAPDVRPEELDPFVGPGNPASFISSVTYGRIFYLLIESTASSTEIEASLDASFRTAAAGGRLGVNAEYVKDLENVKISAYALGGESESAISSITTDFETLKTFLAQGGQINTGVPLSYVVRSVAHRDRIVSVAVATQYDVTSCTPVGESFDKPILWYKADQGVSKDGANRVTRWADSFADPTMDYPTNFVFGSGNTPRTSLELGFRNPSQVSMGHDGPRLDAPVDLPLTGFQVYTFRSAQDGGMKVWLNGSATPAAVGAAQTANLLQYIGARLGSDTGSLVEIAEVKACGEAINDAQRDWLVEKLLVKYSL